ncbi:putative NAD(P)H nitroreductase [Actinobacillus equuli]|nr:putative NAD(P)H nitroreductase [Actinobacillus equuli]
MELKNVIEQRKTIKVFNPNVKIERQELEEMLALTQLAPSKANLQPWRFVVVDDAVQKINYWVLLHLMHRHVKRLQQ